MGQQVIAVNSLGGYSKNNQLTKEIRHITQPLMKFRMFTNEEPVAGRNKGNIVLFDKISNISTQGGTLIETATIPKNNFVISQGQLTMTEYGNSIPLTSKLQSLSELNIDEATKQVLVDDMVKVLDSGAAVQFTAADIKAAVINTATTTIGSASAALATAGSNMSDKNFRDVIDAMKKKNMPRFDGLNYICIASTNSVRGVYDFFEQKAELTNMAPLIQGEVGTYYGCRLIEETNFLSNTLGSGSQYGEAVFFGRDAVREGIAIPEEIRFNVPQDFGRDQGVAWYALLGFQRVWDFTADGDARIIHLTSL